MAILDSGFRGYRKYLGTALPPEVVVRSFRRDGNLEARDSQHGILCGEVIHAIAPEAGLLLANWDPDRPEEFLAAVGWAKAQGARIISCSLIMPSWSDGEGGGPIHTSLTQILGDGRHPGDVLFFASAGNTAQRHWSGQFEAAAGRFHAWQPGQVEQPLIPWGRERVSAELYAPAAADYELFVTDVTAGREVGHTRSRCRDGRCSAVVRFMPHAAHGYTARVRLVGGTAGQFHLVVLGGSLGHATAPGSISFPADGAEVVAVGAVDADGRRLSYSSCGPNSNSPKPDLVAPVPFPSVWRSKPFGGTSAAAPQAAGLAALCWSANPSLSATQVRSALCQAAKDLGQPGFDCETGYGMVHLPEAPVRAAQARR